MCESKVLYGDSLKNDPKHNLDGRRKGRAVGERRHSARREVLYRLRILMLPMPESILMFILPALLA
jgi:hypothetical protein